MENDIIETSEDMLKGETEISHFEQITTWKRALNAARRTVGKAYLDKNPSQSWEAKVLLAEHSPIRLVEYDFGWKKIRQWVTTHLVRHHEGCEKFVHSQRSDRRELPCDRDHIYQGAKNDMDMTCNAQAMINISRKRLCSCASKETREAWKQVMNELEKIDPILRSKCVPECIYRGFCPELSSCGYYKTDTFKKQLVEYRNIKYGKERKFYGINIPNLNIIVENTGHIYECENDIIPMGEISYEKFNSYNLKEVKYVKEKWINGDVLCIPNGLYPICILVYYCFSNDEEYIKARKNIDVNIMLSDIITNIDGNIYNNDIDNLKKEEK